MSEATAPPQFIDSPEALQAFLSELAGAEWLAVDTEFVRERTYFAELCLVQLGDDRRLACIDALTLDLTPLWAFLAEPARIKVLHSASQDIELFVQHTGACPQPLFDTQIAAALLGLGDQISYAALVEQRLGLQLDKSQSRTDWSARPLKAEQLEYAADDVRQLAALFPQLRDELVASGRLGWHAEDCRALCDPARYRPDPDRAWQRLRGLGRLDADSQQVAAALARWREEQAIARDRPRRWILPDEALLALAERRPETVAAVQACTGLPPKQVERNARKWLECVAQAPRGLPRLVEDFRPDAAHKAQVKQLLGVVRERAEDLGVPASLLAARASVEQLVRLGASDDHPALTGWRREVVGERLLQQVAAGRGQQA